MLIDLEPIETLYTQNTFWHDYGVGQDKWMDVHNAIEKMPNERYRYVITELDLKERNPEELALEMRVTIDNLYNIRRRARLQLTLIMIRKEDYL